MRRPTPQQLAPNPTASSYLRGDGTWASTTFAPQPCAESYQIVSSNYTITTGCNASAVGPLEIAAGITLTIPSGATLAIVA